MFHVELRFRNLPKFEHLNQFFMQKINRFQVRDCFGAKLATFSIPQEYLEDFVNETDMPFTKESVKMAQSYFWWLAARYCTGRTVTCLRNSLAHAIDAFFYISYYPYK